jgi:ferritin-like metal-binding protein YciE
MSLKFESLRDLLLQELRELYSAENQLLKAIPQMESRANSQDLKQSFNRHLGETQGHVRRLEQVFERLGEQPKEETCEAMEGLISDGQAYVKANAEEHVRDAALIAAAQRIEHYEIASYGTARTLALCLEDTSCADLLQQTLNEESQTDKKLTELAEAHINMEAAHAH